MSLADMMMELFAMESSLLRAHKLAALGKGANATDMASVFIRDALARIEDSARQVVGRCSPAETLDADWRALRSLTDVEPLDAVKLRRQIAGRLLGREAYVV